MKSVKIIAVLAILSAVIPALNCRAQEEKSEHKGIFMGAGIGKGFLNADFSGKDNNEISEEGITFSYRFGYAFNDMIHIGIDMDLLIYYRASKFRTFAVYSGVINYYFTDMIFIRAGPCVSLIEGEPAGSETDESAFGFMIGAGLDIRIFSKIAFTPVYHFYTTKSSVYSSTYHAFALGGTYYF
jgi:opacity protein-like surface antigen